MLTLANVLSNHKTAQNSTLNLLKTILQMPKFTQNKVLWFQTPTKEFQNNDKGKIINQNQVVETQIHWL